MNKLFTLSFLILLSAGCTLFNELLEPSDINNIIVPSLNILSHTNNEMVGYGYTLSGTVISLSSSISTIRVILDDTITQDTIPVGNNWSISINVSNGVHVNDLYAIDAKGKISSKKSITLDQHTIPLYNIKLKNNEIMIIFDFTGTYDPISWGVIPFIMGDCEPYFSKAGYFGSCIANEGIKIDGTGDQVLKKDLSSGQYYSVLTIPNPSSTNIRFLAANYTPNGWNELLVDFWTHIGNMNSIGVPESIQISNYTIQSVSSFYGYTLSQTETKQSGMYFSPDKKRVIYYIGEHSGWGLHLPGGTLESQTIQLIWTNIPAFIDLGTKQVITNGITNSCDFAWWPLDNIVSNLTFSTVSNSAFPVVCGNNSTVFGGYWNPTTGGIRLTNLNKAAKSASVIFNVPPGQLRFLKCKFVNIFGWDWGWQSWDSFIPVPTVSFSGVTNVFYINFQ